MSTTSPLSGHDAALRRSEAATVVDRFAAGRPVAPDVVERLRARTAQITADIEREHGLVDDNSFQSLLDEDA
jgi:hypothetical protein